jgi:hypothetical protein
LAARALTPIIIDLIADYRTGHGTCRGADKCAFASVARLVAYDGPKGRAACATGHGTRSLRGLASGSDDCRCEGDGENMQTFIHYFFPPVGVLATSSCMTQAS